MNLYQYQKAQVQDGIRDVLDGFQQQDTSWIDQAQAAAGMKFRDRAGRYWMADIYQGDWYFYENGKWLLSSEVPDVLEGVSSLFPGGRVIPESADQDLEAGRAGGGGSPVKVLEDSLRKIRVDYQDGKLSSEAALQTSRRHYLIDLQGGVWTVGLQSGDWHRKENGGWIKEAGPPPPDQLLKMDREENCASCGKALEGSVLCPHCGHENPPNLPDLADEAYGNLLDFFLGDEGLPEDITGPWNPPEGYPESVKEHFVERGVERKFCPHCGEALK
ncbi:MAG: hypothetical protein ACK2TT_06925 [Anaerolineales bacterium]